MARRSQTRTGMVRRLVCSLAALAFVVSVPARAAPTEGTRLTVSKVDTEPREGMQKPTAEGIAAMKKDVAEHPDDRTKRLALVRGLMATKDLDGALAEAKAWRAKDAYNLVAVRALGDVH